VLQSLALLLLFTLDKYCYIHNNILAREPGPLPSALAAEAAKRISAGAMGDAGRWAGSSMAHDIRFPTVFTV
jgi:hypothetical protein